MNSSEYYYANKEKILAAARARYKMNRRKILDYQKRIYSKPKNRANRNERSRKFRESKAGAAYRKKYQSLYMKEYLATPRGWEISRACNRRWKKTAKGRAAERRKAQRARDELRPKYMRALLVKGTGLSLRDIPPELVELQTAKMNLLRQTNNTRT